MFHNIFSLNSHYYAWMYKIRCNNKINCIHVVIFQVNFLLNFLSRAISDMLEHLCLKYISVNYEDMTITVNHSVSKLKMFLLIFK